MKHAIPALALALTFALIGCASAPKAPVTAKGEKFAVQVLIDGGWEQIDMTNANQVDQRTQLVKYMKTAAVQQLNASGYAATSIDTVTAYDAKDGARLLKIAVVDYNAGSAAARLLVGFGAGSAHLDTKATYKDKDQILMDFSNSISSGVDWRKIVKKSNILMIREMAKHGAT